MEIEFVLPGRVDVGLVLRPMRRGNADPTFQTDDRGLWYVTTTPEGAATMRLRYEFQGGDTQVACQFWGPGAQQAAGRVDGLVGGRDDTTGFQELLGLLREAPLPPEQAQLVSFVVQSWPKQGWRVPRSHNVWEAALAAVLEQKVTGKESKGAWRALAHEYGDQAPGPAPEGMKAPPTMAQVRVVPSWKWRNLAVDRPRSDALMRLVRTPELLSRLPELSAAEARRQFTAIPGIGDWTYAEVAQRALGDADAVSFGDYHLARLVIFTLTGRRDGTDEELAELLEPFRGQRYRAVRMFELHGAKPERRGPRMSVPAHRYGQS